MKLHNNRNKIMVILGNSTAIVSLILMLSCGDLQPPLVQEDSIHIQKDTLTRVDTIVTSERYFVLKKDGLNYITANKNFDDGKLEPVLFEIVNGNTDNVPVNFALFSNDTMPIIGRFNYTFYSHRLVIRYDSIHFAAINDYGIIFECNDSVKCKGIADSVRLMVEPLKHVIIGQAQTEFWYVRVANSPYEFLTGTYVRVMENSKYTNVRNDAKYREVVPVTVSISYSNEEGGSGFTMEILD